MTLEMIIISCLLGIVLLLNIIFVIKIYKKNDLKNSGNPTEIKNSFENQAELFKQINQMILNAIKTYNDSITNQITQNAFLQKQEFTIIQARLENILKSNEDRLNRATDVLDKGLTKLQADNEKKLDQMRQTVDEKLNVSLERRLSESFNTINQRLQSVYEGLGEMKTLASGVGDLKKVLTNIKTRGTWGEIQLGNLLEQILVKEQYFEQMDIRNNGERVDFAVVLPGKNNEQIYLPIDAKFPIEDYQRLVDASELGDLKEIETALKHLEKHIKDEAKKIKEKYIILPKTTDFAIMYLATEGLYAEVLRRSGLAEFLQREYKVVVCGPTTLTALLNSLQLGFKTLSIEKRSSEIWQLLGVFKQEFGKFVELLSKTQKKLAEASNTIEFATKKSQTIQRKLKNVATLNGTDLSQFDEDTTLLEQDTNSETEAN
ncbi:MAG: DNA recombination protein RmuC [Clostridia bacterium]|nr:DNA recombination protein RmuC [Clostridia bacterium]